MDPGEWRDTARTREWDRDRDRDDRRAPDDRRDDRRDASGNNNSSKYNSSSNYINSSNNRPNQPVMGSTRGRSRSPVLNHPLPSRPSNPSGPAGGGVGASSSRPHAALSSRLAPRDKFSSGGWSRTDTNGTDWYQPPHGPHPPRDPAAFRERDPAPAASSSSAPFRKPDGRRPWSGDARERSPSPPRGRKRSRSRSRSSSYSPRGKRTGTGSAKGAARRRGRSRSYSPSRSRSRSRSPLGDKGGVFRGLGTFTKSLQDVMAGTQQRAYASRALDRLKGFKADERALAGALTSLSTADDNLRTQTEALQDAFADLLRQALSRPGVGKGDVSNLHIEQLRDRLIKLEHDIPALRESREPGEITHSATPTAAVRPPPKQPPPHPPSMPPPPLPMSSEEAEVAMDLDVEEHAPLAAAKSKQKETDTQKGKGTPQPANAPKDTSAAAKRGRARALLHDLISRVEVSEDKMDRVFGRIDDMEDRLSEQVYDMEDYREKQEEEKRRRKDRAGRLAGEYPGLRAEVGDAITNATGASDAATPADNEGPMRLMMLKMEKMQAEIASLRAAQVPAAVPVGAENALAAPNADAGGSAAAAATPAPSDAPAPAPAVDAVTATETAAAAQNTTRPAPAPTTTPAASASDVAELRKEVEELRSLVTDGFMRPVLNKLLRESLPPVIAQIFEQRKDSFTKDILLQVAKYLGDRGKLRPQPPLSGAGVGPTGSAAASATVSPAPTGAEEMPSPSTAPGGTPEASGSATATNPAPMATPVLGTAVPPPAPVNAQVNPATISGPFNPATMSAPVNMSIGTISPVVIDMTQVDSDTAATIQSPVVPQQTSATQPTAMMEPTTTEQFLVRAAEAAARSRSPPSASPVFQSMRFDSQPPLASPQQQYSSYLQQLQPANGNGYQDQGHPQQLQLQQLPFPLQQQLQQRQQQLQRDAVQQQHHFMDIYQRFQATLYHQHPQMSEQELNNAALKSLEMYIAKQQPSPQPIQGTLMSPPAQHQQCQPSPQQLQAVQQLQARTQAQTAAEPFDVFQTRLVCEEAERVLSSIPQAARDCIANGNYPAHEREQLLQAVISTMQHNQGELAKARQSNEAGAAQHALMALQVLKSNILKCPQKRAQSVQPMQQGNAGQ